jgi:hypothetical protein
METPPQYPQAETPEPSLPKSSIISRIFNVFAAPGEVFDEVKSSPACSANWVVPALIAVVVGWLATPLIFSQEPIRHQLQEMTDQAIEKQVARSKASEQQAEQMRAAAEKFAGMGQKIAAYVMTPVMAFASPFIWGGILWFVGKKPLKANFTYMKAVEVVGLGNMIGVLDSIVRTLLIVSMGNLFASTSLVMLIKEYNPQNPVHNLLAMINIMTFWILGVRASGLARLSGASFLKSVAWVFGIWVTYTGAYFGLGLALQAIFSKITG